MRIPSGKTDQSINFVAFDSSDHTTRKTGLSTFTVYRSRNGGTATVYTTPTMVELSAANMPGVYALLIDEDTTIASGSDSEEYAVHITATGMDPVTRTVELYRRDTTSGRTLVVDGNSRADASVGAMAANVLTATAIAADAITDAKVASDVTIASVTGSVGSVATGGISTASFAAGAIDNAAIATDAIGSAELAASAVTKIQSGLSTLDAAGVRTAVGLASANLDTQLGTIAGYIDTEVGAIKTKTDQLVFTVANQVDVNVLDWKSAAAPAMTGDAFARLGAPAGASVSVDVAAIKTVADAVKTKTDNLPSDPADASDIAASFTTVNGTLATIAGYVDTEVAAIKAKTDNLPSDPADASDIAASFTTINGTLAIIAGYIDTEVGAIKAKTDQLTFTVANQADVNVVDWKGSAAPAMTGDAFARLGAPAGASVSVDIAAVKSVDDAVKAKTDNLPSDPADASDIAASFSTVNGTLATIAGYVDTEIGAIKAVTDNIGTMIEDITGYRFTTHALERAPTGTGGGSVAPTVQEIRAEIDTSSTQLAAIKAKTDNLPSDPADQSLIIAATDTVRTDIAALPTTTVVNAIKAKTDNLPASPATQTSVDAVKVKTDQLTFSKTAELDVNIQSVNDVTVIGTGASGHRWGPA